MASTNKYFPQIDGLRCYSLVLVCVAHWIWQQDWVHVFRFGATGLEMFFVISGFLITRILLSSKDAVDDQRSSTRDRLKTFYIRRVLRIFPAYYAVLLITFIFNDGIVRETIWWNLFYGTNFYLMKLGEWAGVISHFWSLAAEEQFYLFWPFLIFLVPRRHLLKTMVAAILFSFGLRVVMTLMQYKLVTIHVFTPLALDCFGLGGLLAYLAMKKEDLLLKIINDWKWVFMVFFILLIVVDLIPVVTDHYGFANIVFPRTLTGLLFFWVVAKAYYGFDGVMKTVLENKWIVYFGKISYAGYLYHNFIPGFYLGLKFPESDYLRMGLYFITLILVSAISQKLIEAPFNSLKKRFKYI